MQGISRDSVIVGSGIGGLIAACYLSKAGQRVSLLETASTPGGLCRSIRKDGLTWNTSLYSIRGCKPGGPFHRILAELELADEITFMHSKKSYLINISGTPFPITTEIDEIMTAADKLQDNGAAKIKPLLEKIINFSPVHDFAELSGIDFREAARKYGINDLLLNALAAPFIISLGLPPRRTSAFFAFLKYQLLLQEGVSYPHGGADHLISRLVAKFSANGGELLLNQRVNEISEEADAIKKVTTIAGLTRWGKQLVINGDATSAIEMLGRDLPPKFGQKTARLTPSLSANLLYMATSRKNIGAIHLDRYPHVIYLNNTNLDDAYNRIRKGDNQASSEVYGLTSPATWNFGEAGEENQPLTAFFLSSLEHREPNYSPESLRQTIHDNFPAPKDDLELKLATNPEDLRRQTSNRAGSFCGWEMGPERYGPDRIQQRLSSRGIFLAGHWTDPGPSILNCALSGRKAALAVLKNS